MVFVVFYISKIITSLRKRIKISGVRIAQSGIMRTGEGYSPFSDNSTGAHSCEILYICDSQDNFSDSTKEKSSKNEKQYHHFCCRYADDFLQRPFAIRIYGALPG